MADRRMELEEARELAERCLRANGCDNENARPVAASMITCERDICLSHGLFRLPGYVLALRSGRINGCGQPSVAQAAPGVLRVHGDNAMAPVAHAAAFDRFAESAHEHGTAALAITRVFHFSALWVELEVLAAKGLAAFACTSALPYVAPAGASSALFGTNPIGFGWPRGDGRPVIFDMATAAMARGEISIAARDGHELPPGAGVGPDGEATVDPAAVLAGAQLPFGGYKGSALAMMVELLAGPLMGETLSFETAVGHPGDASPFVGGEFLLAMSPERFGAEGWREHAERLFSRIDALEGARLPGDRRYANRARTAREGIGVAESLYEKIVQLTEEGSA